MCAVTRPRYDYTKKKLFDGKIGIWPFSFTEAAKRNSKNRQKGTMVTKPIESITKDEVRTMIEDNVFPAIREKFPQSYKRKPIYLQQDNAKPHTAVDDLELCREGRRDGWNLQLVCQPANSPDLNVLDLGFFNSIQSLQHQYKIQNVDDLILAVEESFRQLDPVKLDNIFLTQQKCMEEVMRLKGGNEYSLPHLKKKQWKKDNEFILNSLKCDKEVILLAKNALNE